MLQENIEFIPFYLVSDFRLGIVNVEISRRYEDQSIVRIVTITKPRDH